MSKQQRRPDLRKYKRQGTYIARLSAVPAGSVFRHCQEDSIFRKDCDAYQTRIEDGKTAILTPRDLVEVLPKFSAGVAA